MTPARLHYAVTSSDLQDSYPHRTSGHTMRSEHMVPIAQPKAHFKRLRFLWSKKAVHTEWVSKVEKPGEKTSLLGI